MAERANPAQSSRHIERWHIINPASDEPLKVLNPDGGIALFRDGLKPGERIEVVPASHFEAEVSRLRELADSAYVEGVRDGQSADAAGGQVDA